MVCLDAVLSLGASTDLSGLVLFMNEKRFQRSSWQGDQGLLLWDESVLKVILVDPLTLGEKNMTTFVSLLSLAFIHEKMLLLLASSRKNRSGECCRGLWPCDYAILMLSVTHSDDRRQHFLFYSATMLSEQGWPRGKQRSSDSSATLQRDRWWGLTTVAS